MASRLGYDVQLYGFLTKAITVAFCAEGDIKLFKVRTCCIVSRQYSGRV